MSRTNYAYVAAIL